MDKYNIKDVPAGIYQLDSISPVCISAPIILPDLPDYEIHSDGTIWRITTWPCQVCPIDDGRGYKKVRLRINKIRKNYKVHRLICRAYHGNPPIYNGEEAHVRHLDNNPANNAAKNLCRGSRSDNERDKRRYKTF
jgi:hypothetical protein